jgi:hypothetical protein
MLGLWAALAVGWAGVAVDPVLGVEVRPLARADLAWVLEGRTTGTAVGGEDGLVRPVVAAYGGVAIDRWVHVLAQAGVAQSTLTTRVDDVITTSTVGVVRLGSSVRAGWVPRRLLAVRPFVQASFFADIPMARTSSESLSEEEAASVAISDRSTRGRLGALGGSGGVGVLDEVLPGLGVGAVFSVGARSSAWPTTAGGTRSSWVTADAALLIEFRGGRPAPADRNGPLHAAPPEPTPAMQTSENPPASDGT